MVRKPPTLLRFGQGVFRIGQDVGDVHGSAFEQRSSDDASRVPAAIRCCLTIFPELGREPVDSRRDE